MTRPKLPDADLRVSFGRPSLPAVTPMPAARRAGYRRRILQAARAQQAGARRARDVFVG